MAVTAKLRFARITPRKARLVADAVRGLPAEHAVVRLRVLKPRAARIVFKLLQSALANAKANFNLDSKNLRIARLVVNEGPRLKRWMPRARGAANRILKRTSHVEIALDAVGPAPEHARYGAGGPQSASWKRKAEMETLKAEELTSDELRAQERMRRGEERTTETGAVKPATAPRGVRRLLERKHGGE